MLSYVLDVVGVARKRGLLDGGHVVVAADDERALMLDVKSDNPDEATRADLNALERFSR